MNKLVFAVIISVLISSCAMIQEKFPSKRYKQCVSDNEKLKLERDKLIDDTTVLHLRILEMQKEYDALTKNYTKSLADYRELNEEFNKLNKKYDFHLYSFC